MVLGGFWHGANWTFLLWGVWHGTWLAIERLLGGKTNNPYPRAIAWPFTLLLVMLGWVMFRAPDIGTAFGMYAGMFGAHGVGLSDTIAWQMTGLQIGVLAIALLVVVISPHYIRIKSARDTQWAQIMPVWEQGVISVLFLLAFCKLIAQSHSPFLYFQF